MHIFAHLVYAVCSNSSHNAYCHILYKLHTQYSAAYTLQKQSTVLTLTSHQGELLQINGATIIHTWTSAEVVDLSFPIKPCIYMLLSSI